MLFDKHYLLTSYKYDFDLIKSIIENHIHLANNKCRNYASIPTNDFGHHLYYIEEQLKISGFDVSINSMYVTIRW